MTIKQTKNVITNNNIRYVDNGYINGNVLSVHNELYQKLIDMRDENQTFDMWKWCEDNLFIMEHDNDEDIINTEKSDTFAYHRTKLNYV